MRTHTGAVTLQGRLPLLAQLCRTWFSLFPAEATGLGPGSCRFRKSGAAWRKAMTTGTPVPG